MNFEDVIKNRFSVRSFKDDKIEREKLDKILRAGLLAPTAKNKQPFKIYVFESDEALKKIDEASRCRYNAPTCLVIAGSVSESFNKENYSSYEMDASIVTTHMMLEAFNLGIDTTWIKLIDEKMLEEYLNLDEDMKVVCMLNLGYRSEGVEPFKLHDESKTLEEVVTYL